MLTQSPSNTRPGQGANGRYRLLALLAAGCVSFAVPTAIVHAADPAGMIKTSKGMVNIERDGRQLAATVGTTVAVRDRLVTGSDGAVGLTLRDNTLLSAGPNSVLDLNKFAFDTTTHAGTLDASIKKGTLSVISGKLAKANPDAVVFAARSTTLGVRGTEFIIEAGQAGE